MPARGRKHKMDSAWKVGIYLGQRAVSREYLVGAKEGIFRPRTVHRVPVEPRCEDNLSFAAGLPWKHNMSREEGEAVMLDTYAPEPSLHPRGVPLPPIMMEDPCT